METLDAVYLGSLFGLLVVGVSELIGLEAPAAVGGAFAVGLVLAGLAVATGRLLVATRRYGRRTEHVVERRG